jgi:hypothetical protein
LWYNRKWKIVERRNIMKKYLLPENGSFYKANLHCHINLSDGELSPQEVKELYKQLGYSIVAYTDHDLFIPHDELNDENFLSLHGMELEITEKDPGKTLHMQRKTCHFCAIALDKDNLITPCWHREKYYIGNGKKYKDLCKFDESQPDYNRYYNSYCINDMMHQFKNANFFVTYNHPTWSLETYPQYIQYCGMHAMEIFNGSCIKGGDDDINPRAYDDMLREGKRIFCIGADDNHNFPADPQYSDSGVAYTVIKANSLKYEDVAQALKNGDFYASMGPEIKELYVEDGNLYIKTSPAVQITLSADIRGTQTVIAKEGETVDEACFKIREEFKYFRLTVIDHRGQRACTNAFFTDTL